MELWGNNSRGKMVAEGFKLEISVIMSTRFTHYSNSPSKVTTYLKTAYVKNNKKWVRKYITNKICRYYWWEKLSEFCWPCDQYICQNYLKTKKYHVFRKKTEVIFLRISDIFKKSKAPWNLKKISIYGVFRVGILVMNACKTAWDLKRCSFAKPHFMGKSMCLVLSANGVGIIQVEP